MAQPKKDTRTQREKFIEAANLLGASDDGAEKLFKRALKAVAKAPGAKAKKAAKKRKR
jgi:hypothetical protein